MKKISKSKKIRRNTLDNITRIAAEGLQRGEPTAEILVSILADIHGKVASKKKPSASKKPGPKPKKRGRKPASIAKKKGKAAPKAAKNLRKPPHGYIFKAVAKGTAKGKTSREILTALKKKYPDCKTTINTISLYKKKVRDAKKA